MQNSQTAREIALAAARLGENSRDPRVGDAIRRRQDASRKLDELYQLRASAAGATSASQLSEDQAAELDRRIRDAQSVLRDVDRDLQRIAPNYGQLLQDFVSTTDVQEALAPDEAFVAITLGVNGGWIFVIRKHAIGVAKVSVGVARMTELVTRLRASVEPVTGELPQYDVDAARAIYDETLGKLDSQLEGVSALSSRPSGPLAIDPLFRTANRAG